MQRFNGLREIADKYDVFIVDQWGVLHDGLTAYPAAIASLHQLKRLAKKTFLLSNSSNTAFHNEEKLNEMGVPRSLFDFVLTSGEILRRKLLEGDNPLGLPGPKCFIMGIEHHSLLEGTPITKSTLGSADFILLSGLAPDLGALEKFKPMLKIGIDRNLPMLCANSDNVYTLGNQTYPAGGQLAQTYADMGGLVFHFGKPHKIAFDACIAKAEADKSKILMIGDSLEHDIRGAKNAGIDSVFVTSGIHKESLPVRSDVSHDMEIEKLCVRQNLRPTWVTEKLCW